MKNVTININTTSFPSQLVTDAEKASDAFGLQVGQAIQYEWFRKDGKEPSTASATSPVTI